MTHRIDPAHLTITKLHQTLAAGDSIVVSLRAASGHAHVIEWARRYHLFVPVDRTSAWGNPFVLGRDVNRDDVLAAHARHLTDRPDLLARLRRGELASRVLGCWCAPQPCHAHTLTALTRNPDLAPFEALRA